MATFAKINRKNIKHCLLVALQVTGFCGFAWLCQTLAIYINSPIPGSVIGLTILLLLLSLKLIPERSVSLASKWLIGELLLFFIPPVVAVIKYQALLEHFGAVLIGAMLAASTCVLVGTAFTVDKLFKFEHKMHLKRQAAKTVQHVDQTMAVAEKVLTLPKTSPTDLAPKATEERQAA
ncbi:CidA/LrgA family protein [Shewanella pneumatophori]|uniref:CidA/LrgA family protein n=1 Tax=Shewanella pneumatophori TaxID=314092 RepID=A0A9X2CD33_9GAMM|nr:CidA/LrgA family protein [Shewanella pneumatophori]MCL1138753.1 CidA/LrgA family protein [Shewanella pneumatophori]